MTMTVLSSKILASASWTSCSVIESMKAVASSRMSNAGLCAMARAKASELTFAHREIRAPLAQLAVHPTRSTIWSAWTSSAASSLSPAEIPGFPRFETYLTDWRRAGHPQRHPATRRRTWDPLISESS